MGAPPQGARRKIRAPPAERQETRDHARDKGDGKRQEHGEAPSASQITSFTDRATEQAEGGST